MSTVSLTLNPMVEYLSSLRTQDERGQPLYIHENRRELLDSLRREHPWFATDADLYVRTRLDGLAEVIAEGKLAADLVLLTGDAGDGKTALCESVARRLGFSGDLEPQTTIGSWTVVKDASEIAEEDLLEQIETALATRRSGRGLVVAINEGRLRRLAHGGGAVLEARRKILPSLWPTVLQPSLEAWLDAPSSQSLDVAMRAERVLVLNFRHRAHLREVTPALLDAWTKERWWEGSPACSTCPARASCPILANVADLRTDGAKRAITDRFSAAHFGGTRLPFRRLQGALALTTTGGLRCADVQSAKFEAADPIERLDYRFYAAFFRRDASGPIAVRPEPIARAFGAFDPQREVAIDRERDIAEVLAGPDAIDRVCGVVLGSMEREALEHATRRTVEGDGTLAHSSLLPRVIRALRRWSAFQRHGFEDATWRRALVMLEGFARDDRDPVELRASVVEAINRLHGVDETKRDEITAHQMDSAAFRHPSRRCLEIDLGVPMETRLACGPILPPFAAEFLETMASDVILEARPARSSVPYARLSLDQQLVQALLGVCSGYEDLGGLGPYRRDLARFHGKLAALASDAGYLPRVIVRAAGCAWRVGAVTRDGVARLTLDGVG